MRKILLAIIILLMAFGQAFSQTQTNTAELQRLATKFQEKSNADKIEVLNYARINNVPTRIETDSSTMEMMFINAFGMPEYYQTENKNAAATVSANKVHNGGGAGLNLDGSGMTIHEWDGGGVLTTHQEFGSRVTQGDSPSGTNYHSTHVAGTMIASGVDPNAKGMLPAASLRAFEWTDDNTEMATEAGNGALISNHSYGLTRGWRYDSTNEEWYWYGTTTVSQTEDYLFGFYDTEAQAWDEIAYNAPYYLICKSAGNDRGDYYSGTHWVWINGGWKERTNARDADGGSTGYDCIGSQGTAKNILTVGAINDIPNSYEQSSDVVMSSFSGWGPTDDGRIKPDIVANGVGLYSTDSDNNTDYYSMSGTSMASPNAAGALLLLQEHYENLNGTGTFMRSATLKALAIHTADEASSNPGPDYQNGWGLLNIERAAAKITEDQTNDIISEHTLSNGTNYTTTITATSGFPIKVTIVWTDPKGTPTSAQLDPSTAMLVNDLDLRVTSPSATVHYPWKLNRTNPANAATRTGENDVDNVEVVYIENPTPGGIYTIRVDHDGTLASAQAFSMIISGYPLAPTANFYTDKKAPQVNETVSFTDASTENPTSWSWSISPATYNFVNTTSSTSQNPQVEFTDIGFYTITLYAQNASGNNTEVKTDYIFATNAPTGYCDAYSTHPYGTISRVQFNTIDNSSAYTNVGLDDPDDEYYDDFTAIITDLIRLESKNLTVSSNYTDTGLDLGVWIDWNRDGDFDDTGENVVCEEDGGGVGTFSISVPIDASLGHTRMRLRTKYSNSGCGSSCGSTVNGEVEDYSLNILPIPQLPPVADFVADNTTPVTNVTVNFTDQSTNIPTSWLWTFTPNTVTYVGGTSSSSQNPQVEFTTLGNYEVTLYAENAHGNNTEVKTDYISVVESPTGYCIANSVNFLGYIDDVTFNTIINNTSGYTDIGGGKYYQDFTSMETEVKLLEQHSLYVHNSYNNDYEEDLDLGVWIDWNRDGDFDDLGENEICEFSNYGEGTFNITIPSNAELGKTRMRIRAKFYDDDCGSSCGETTYGEVEDYTVIVKAGTLTWDGSESTDWNDPLNWDGEVVPTEKFHAIIPDATTVPFSPVIGSTLNVMCATCTLQQGANLTSVGNLTLFHSE